MNKVENKVNDEQDETKSHEILSGLQLIVTLIHSYLFLIFFVFVDMFY